MSIVLIYPLLSTTALWELENVTSVVTGQKELAVISKLAKKDLCNYHLY